VLGVQVCSVEHEWPYGLPEAGRVDQGEPLRLTLVPYYMWSNRSNDAMRVWIPRAGCDSASLNSSVSCRLVVIEVTAHRNG